MNSTASRSCYQFFAWTWAAVLGDKRRAELQGPTSQKVPIFWASAVKAVKAHWLRWQELSFFHWICLGKYPGAEWIAFITIKMDITHSMLQKLVHSLHDDGLKPIYIVVLVFEFRFPLPLQALDIIGLRSQRKKPVCDERKASRARIQFSSNSSVDRTVKSEVRR